LADKTGQNLFSAFNAERRSYFWQRKELDNEWQSRLKVTADELGIMRAYTAYLR